MGREEGEQGKGLWERRQVPRAGPGRGGNQTALDELAVGPFVKALIARSQNKERERVAKTRRPGGKTLVSSGALNGNDRFFTTATGFP